MNLAVSDGMNHQGQNTEKSRKFYTGKIYCIWILSILYYNSVDVTCIKFSVANQILLIFI